MAKRAVYQYQPWNETPDQGIGIKLPFNKAAHQRAYDHDHYASGSRAGGGVFVSSYTTEEQSISNFRNLLMTHKGERIMQPNFGISIRKYLFEQNTELVEDLLTVEIKEGVGYWLPYISIRKIDVNRLLDEHQLKVFIRFRVSTTGANLVINILANENALIVSDAVPDVGTRVLQQVGTVSAPGIGNVSAIGGGSIGGGSVGGGGGGGY